MWAHCTQEAYFLVGTLHKKQINTETIGWEKCSEGWNMRGARKPEASSVRVGKAGEILRWILEDEKIISHPNVGHVYSAFMELRSRWSQMCSCPVRQERMALSSLVPRSS